MKKWCSILAILLLVGCGGADPELENTDETFNVSESDGDGEEPDGDGEEPYGDGEEPDGDGEEPGGDGEEPGGDGEEPDGDGEEPDDEECPDGEQDNNDDGVCLPDCSAEICGANSTCDDSSGVALCLCDAGFQDNDGDGVCREDCDTALTGGPGFEGRCDGCGTDASSWSTANSNAQNACNASGCTDGCTASTAAWDNCYFDGETNGYVCTSYCGAAPLLECGENASCDDSEGTAVCDCDAGFQDNDGDGLCREDCDTATAGGPGFEGRCDGCGTDASSWSAANSNAQNACNASGCTDGCSVSIAAWDNCYFDGATNGYVCISYCGEIPELVCLNDQICEDSSGEAVCE